MTLDEFMQSEATETSFGEDVFKVYVKKPRMVSGFPVPPCDLIVTQWREGVTQFMTLAEPQYTIRFEGVPRAFASVLSQRGYKRVGPLCDRVFVSR